MKKIFFILLITSFIFTVGCGKTNIESSQPESSNALTTTSEDTPHKTTLAEVTTQTSAMTSKSSESVTVVTSAPETTSVTVETPVQITVIVGDTGLVSLISDEIGEITLRGFLNNDDFTAENYKEYTLTSNSDIKAFCDILNNVSISEFIEYEFELNSADSVWEAIIYDTNGSVTYIMSFAKRDNFFINFSKEAKSVQYFLEDKQLEKLRSEIFDLTY